MTTIPANINLALEQLEQGNNEAVIKKIFSSSSMISKNL